MKPIQPFVASNDDSAYTVQYQAYDPRLPTVFADLKSLVQAQVGSVTVEHVGSTSIPGVGGRNALDVAVAVEDSERPAILEALHRLGFQDSPFPHYLPLLVGRLPSRGSSYSILLYVISPQSHVYRDWLAFRDYMRTHPADALAYDAVKQRAILDGEIEGERYQTAKAPFLTSISAKLGLKQAGEEDH